MPRQAERLCLACTLCCNGGLFADLKLSPTDIARLQGRGINLQVTRSAKLPQPCQALCGARCNIYASRPDYCRRFECLLLMKVNSGEVSEAAAMRTIRTARRRLEKVKKLLRLLGDEDEFAAVAVRFRRLARDFETTPTDLKAIALFGDLTLAMHELSHGLAAHFYPGG